MTDQRRIIPTHFVEQYKVSGCNDFTTPLTLDKLGKSCIETTMLGGVTVAVCFGRLTKVPLEERLRRRGIQTRKYKK